MYKFEGIIILVGMQPLNAEYMTATCVIENAFVLLHKILLRHSIFGIFWRILTYNGHILLCKVRK